ncbi:hypothetical protein KAK07_16635 [Ideonella sp. 4Y16]|uniref:Uncharacterized protein n=1 Tax=Ideonella alba TaxID=2824118 RepID=A0A941BLQ3_9BURK|nr:hypothetical protein [Ideonella alba]MBQ0931444.1 hypothetical protein [Ideonella alba]MBQ0944967.1 hypothetical protein [Ideonella alba]
MHIVAIAWGFVVVMMAAAEATAPRGSLLGALFILLGYGVLPLWILLYILGTPLRRRARQAAEAPAENARSGEPDRGRVATGDPVPPEREEA